VLPLYSSTPHYDILLNTNDQAYYSFYLGAPDRVVFDITYPSDPANSFVTTLYASVADWQGNVVANSLSSTVTTVGSTSTAEFTFDLPYTDTPLNLWVSIGSTDPSPIPIGITSHSQPGIAPTNCTGWGLCPGGTGGPNGGFGVHCDGTNDRPVLQEWVNGAWSTAATGTVDSGGTWFQAPWPSSTPAPTGATVTVQPCAHDANPTLACAPSFTITMPNCACTPFTCAGVGANCGTMSDGCGGTLSCGTCSSSAPYCVSNTCYTTPPRTCRYGDCGGYCCPGPCGPRNPGC
jgi:hypothetical protein